MSLMILDDSIVIGAFSVLSAAVAILWRQQVKDARENKKKFEKLEAELKQAIRERCIRGGGDPRPCLGKCDFEKRGI
jgi:hypothetical protein